MAWMSRWLLVMDAMTCPAVDDCGREGEKEEMPGKFSSPFFFVVLFLSLFFCPPLFSFSALFIGKGECWRQPIACARSPVDHLAAAPRPLL